MKIHEPLFSLYLSFFSNHGESALKAICNCSIPSQVVLLKYKSLPPIETLPDEEKKKLKEYVIELFPEKTIEEKINCCRIVYTVGSFL